MLIDVSKEDIFAKIHCAGCGTWMRVRQIFANFEIQGLLGEGGQGMVYRATDLKLNRPLAVKVIRKEFSKDKSFKKRFESEAKITASLNHPNIVKVYSYGEDQGMMYLAMEMVASGSLDAMMADAAKVPEDRALEVGAQIAQGLRAGLEKGLIHRDIKPGNILFAKDGTSKIVDFGLAILVEKQSEEEGEMWATPYYVAPEKLDGTPEDFRSDMYSLAATLFHAIAGRPPFITETNSMGELKKIKSRPVHLLSFAPGVCNATAFVIDKALSANPKDRFESYDAFIENLEFARAEIRKAHSAPKRRMIIPRVEDGGSWITFGAVSAVVAVGLYFWLNRAVSQPKPAASVVAKIEPSVPVDERYTNARKDLLKGKHEQAAAAFRELYRSGKLDEPLHSWSGVHEALAELLIGRPVIAQETLKKLGAELSPNAIGADLQLNAFFAKLAKHGSDSAPTDYSESGKYDAYSVEALGLLVAGLKNWELGAHANAAEWLKAYRNARPTGPAEWVREYRRYANERIDDFETFNSVAAEIRNYESAPEVAQNAIKNLTETKSKMKSHTLVSMLSDLERDFGSKINDAVAATGDAMKKKIAEQEAAESAAMLSLKQKLKRTCESYRFAEALALIKSAPVTLPQNIAERDLLEQRISWLAKFKEQLVRDLSKSSYTAPLTKKNGQKLAGGVARVTDTQIEIRVAFGNVPLLWSDVAPESVMAMAASFLKPTLPIDNLAERQWHIGVFGLFTGKVNEGVQFMDAAAAIRDEYRVQRAMFFPSTTQEASPPPAPTPTLDEPGSL